MKIESLIRDFDLTHIFECGQCFRWKKLEDGSYDIAAMGRRVNVSFEDGVLQIDPCTPEEFESVWKNYFDLSRDYSIIKETLCAGDPVMQAAVSYGSGIRILRQDLWETIVSFIISQNNNIPRIQGCIERLCGNFGRPLGGIERQHGNFGRTFSGISGSMMTDLMENDPEKKDVHHPYNILTHDIPSPETLASLSVEELAPVKLGYRADYLIKAARQVIDSGMPSDREELLALTGVGPKVASCIELFGMSHMDSFPIDVWVRRLMHELYGLDENNKKAMEEYAKGAFGEYGGIAQQYLFYYMREKSRQ